jgi:hypothetical protein
MNRPTHNVNAIVCLTVAVVAGVLGLAVGTSGRQRMQARSGHAPRTDDAARPMVRVELNRTLRIPQQATPARARRNRASEEPFDGTASF